MTSAKILAGIGIVALFAWAAYSKDPAAQRVRIRTFWITAAAFAAFVCLA